MEPRRPPVSTAGFWDDLYAEGQDGWDLGEPAPALVDWLDAGGRFEPAGERSGLSADWGSAEAMSGPPQMKKETIAQASARQRAGRPPSNQCSPI